VTGFLSIYWLRDTCTEQTHSQSYIDRRIYCLLSFVIVFTTTIRVLLPPPHWCNRREDQTAVKIIVEFLLVSSIRSQHHQNRHHRHHESVCLFPFDSSAIRLAKASNLLVSHTKSLATTIVTITVLSFLPPSFDSSITKTTTAPPTKISGRPRKP
jgi:hypothetical protein